MRFVELDPAIALKVIEGYKNELEPQRLALEAFYRQFRCKRCGGPCSKQMVSGHVFADAETLVPRCVLRCGRCACTFDPHSGIVISVGDGARLTPDAP
jgi:hypothetical protein